METDEESINFPIGSTKFNNNLKCNSQLICTKYWKEKFSIIMYQRLSNSKIFTKFFNNSSRVNICYSEIHSLFEKKKKISKNILRVYKMCITGSDVNEVLWVDASWVDVISYLNPIKSLCNTDCIHSVIQL